MRGCVRLHAWRGGRVLHLFLHSSELLPGASPNVPDTAAATALYRKLYDFLAWLRESRPVRGVTAAQLRPRLRPWVSARVRPDRGLVMARVCLVLLDA